MGKIAAIFFLIFVNVTLLLVIGENISAAICFFLLCFFMYLVPNKGYRLDMIFLFCLATLVVIGVHQYWTFLHGSSYYLGADSDDWNFDVFWSDGYIEKYGVSPVNIYKHVGVQHNSVGYVYVIVLLRWLGENMFGYSTFLPRILNVFLLCFTGYYASKIVNFFNSRFSIMDKRALYSVVLIPVLLTNSSYVFRDTIVMFIIVFFFYALVVKRKSYSYIFIVIIMMVFMIFLRQGNFLLLLLTIPLLYIKPKNYSTIGIVVLLILLPFSFYFFEEIILKAFASANKYDDMNTDRLGYLGASIFGLPKIIGFVPRLTYLIFTPVPSFSNLYQFFISTTAFFQIGFFPFLIYSFYNRRIDLRLKLYFLVYFFSVALSTATFRHVMMYMPIGIILICIQSYYQEFVIDKKYISYQISLSLLFVFSIVTALLY